jgi:hypothetical protein
VDEKLEKSLMTLRNDPDHAVFPSMAYPVPDGVLDQRLEDHVRYSDFEKIVRHAEPDFQTVPEATLFYLQISTDERQLSMERDFLCSGPFERGAQ